MNHYQDTAEESLKWTWKIKPPTNMTYQTELKAMNKKGIQTVEYDYMTCYECGSYEDCDCEGYNQALQDVLPVIERAVAAERERASEYMTPEDGAAYLEALTITN